MGGIPSAAGRLLDAIGGTAEGDQTDAQLLERFVRAADAAALAALVRRHGPMVWHVCRRGSTDAHAAEDAFQAAFLVLLRRAGAIRRPEQLANWLFGVARRTAARARVLAGRHRAREHPLPDDVPTETGEPDPWSDLRPVLDEELERLPARYRAPLVLCYLEGRTYSEAARALGWAEGTVSGRLARARDILRDRLTRRGLALSAGTLVTVLSGGSSLTAGEWMVCGFRLRAVLSCAMNEPGALSPGAISLSEGVLRAMWMTKLKLVATACLVTTVLGAGLFSTLKSEAGAAPVNAARVDAPLPSAGPPLALPNAPITQPVAVRADPKAPDVTSPDQKLRAIGDGSTYSVFDTATGKILFKNSIHKDTVTALAFSPDGKVLASGGADKKIHFCDVATGKALRAIETNGTVSSLTYSADGKTLTAKDGNKTRTWDAATGQEIEKK
jgi:RNA polymerase sigma factor (sigma-70 family)